MARRCIVHVTASLKMGGAEHFLYQLVAGLQPTTDQRVICFCDGVFGERIRTLGVPVYVVPYGPLFFINFLRTVRQCKPDIIHSLLWASNVAARLAGWLVRVPVVCAIHSPVNSDGYDSRLRGIIDRLTIGLADHTVAVSQHVCDTCHALRLLPAHKVTVIDNGIDVDYIHQLAQTQRMTRADLGLDPRDIVVGNVGRLVPLKNQQLLIRALAYGCSELATLQLVIVGDGPLRAELEELADSLNVRDRVHFVSGVAASYYPLFDVFVLPSHVEGLSMALLEAMSFGLPVLVASQTLFHDVIVHCGNGMIFDSGDVVQLAILIQALYGVKGLRKRLGAAAQKTVHERYHFNRVIEQYRSVFEAPSRQRGAQGSY